MIEILVPSIIELNGLHAASAFPRQLHFGQKRPLATLERRGEMPKRPLIGCASLALILTVTSQRAVERSPALLRDATDVVLLIIDRLGKPLHRFAKDAQVPDAAVEPLGGVEFATERLQLAPDQWSPV
jgi:hypothetical protein